MLAETQSSCMKRLSRNAGQVRGIARMIEEDRSCIEVVNQVSAARAALASVQSEIIRDHVWNCVSHAGISGDKSLLRQQVTEFVGALPRMRH